MKSTGYRSTNLSSVGRSIIRQIAIGMFAVSTSIAWCAPNIVLIILDNANRTDVDFMPLSTGYLRTNGAEFSNAFVSSSLCCPSRASILTGKYSQNTGVYRNAPPDGGFDTFYRNGNEANTIGTLFKANGYATAFIGKYLNGYGNGSTVPKTYVPPGWDIWNGMLSNGKYYNYKLNENGVVVQYGATPADYQTDRLAEKASSAIALLLTTGRPFILILSPMVPHLDTDSPVGQPIPAPRHANLFEGLKAPRSASFNETDISDKPHYIGKAPSLTAEDILWLDNSYRARVQALQSADEMIGALIDQLDRSSALKSTIIILLSDSGWFFGEHRQRDGTGKMYEPLSRIPMLMAGPSILSGRSSDQMMVNVDLLPTMAEFAGIAAPTIIDGRSVAGFVRGRDREVSGGRKSFLRIKSTTSAGLRLATYSYYETYLSDGSIDFRELYDLRVDPDETQNIFDRVSTDSANSLRSALASFRRCAAEECRSLENSIGDELVSFVPISSRRERR